MLSRLDLTGVEGSPGGGNVGRGSPGGQPGRSRRMTPVLGIVVVAALVFGGIVVFLLAHSSDGPKFQMRVNSGLSFPIAGKLVVQFSANGNMEVNETLDFQLGPITKDDGRWFADLSPSTSMPRHSGTLTLIVVLENGT